MQWHKEKKAYKTSNYKILPPKTRAVLFSSFEAPGRSVVILLRSYARISMGLTVSRQTAYNLTVNSQKWLFFTVNRQNCILLLTVKKVQGISNLAFFSISAALHGPLAAEESPNWKTSSHVLKTLLLEIIRP